MCFHIPDSYPFKPPKLFIKGVHYNDMLCTSSTDPFIKNELRKLNITQCMCINSYLCNNNWSPAITLSRPIEEYFKNKSIMKPIIYKKWILICWIKKEMSAPELVDIIVYFIE